MSVLQSDLNKKTRNITSFIDFQTPGTIRFGQGSVATLKDEIRIRNSKNICIISDKGLERAGVVEKIKKLIALTGVQVNSYTDIIGEPTFQLVIKAITHVKAVNADLIVGVGGGSALDVAKTSAALSDKENPTVYFSGDRKIENRTIPCILLPTTSGTGAEVTKNAIFGDEKNGVKRGIVSAALLPDAAIIDPELTISCPAKVTAASGVDAFTHAIESYIAVYATEHTRMYSEKAMKLFPQYITKAVHNGKDLEARIGMSWVSLFAGIALANAGVGAVHALAYPLGGTFHIEHGVANALLMPFVFNVIGKACTEDMVRVASFLKLGNYTETPHDALNAVVNYLYRLLDDLNLPTSLKELGVEESALPKLAEQAVQVKRLLSNTPYQLHAEQILTIYKNAYAGEGLT